MLTQPNSRYQLAAEYILPPGFTLPGSIAEAQQVAATATASPHGDSADSSVQAHGQHHHHQHHQQHNQQQHSPTEEGRQQQQQQQSPEGGRWRVQLVVPHAAVEELLPAGQLLRQASRRAGTDYHKAKTSFLRGLSTAAISAGEEFSSQVGCGPATSSAQHTHSTSNPVVNNRL